MYVMTGEAELGASVCVFNDRRGRGWSECQAQQVTYGAGGEVRPHALVT